MHTIHSMLCQHWDFIMWSMMRYPPFWKWVILYYTVWPEILAGRYFGGLLKICHVAEFTLAVEPVLSHNDIHSKMANRRARNLNGPWSSFHWVRMKSMIKCNWQLNKSLITLTLDCFHPVGLYSDSVHVCLDRLPRVDRQATSFLWCTKLFGEAISPYAAFNGKLHAND